MLATNLLFTLGEHYDIHRQRSARAQQRLERFHVEKELPFVVDRAPREDLSRTNRWFEGRAVPELERLSGLHVVVPVRKDGRSVAAGATPLANDNGMARCPMNGGLEPGVAHTLRNPFRGARRVRVMLRTRAYGWNAQQLE